MITKDSEKKDITSSSENIQNDNNDNTEAKKSEGSSSSDSDSGSGSGSGSGSENSGSEVISAKNGVENLGVAVFKDDKYVGNLNAEETLAHLILTHRLKSCNLSVPDPDKDGNLLDLYISSNYDSKIEVNIIQGLPYIKVNTNIKAAVSSVDGIPQDVTSERISRVEKSAEDYVRNLLSEYLYKTSRQYKSDISDFGKYALIHFKTYNEFVDYNWRENYQNAVFDINTNVIIKSSFLLAGA